MPNANNFFEKCIRYQINQRFEKPIQNHFCIATIINMAEHNPAQTPMDKRVSWGNACVREYDKTPFAENFSLDDREIVTPLGQVSPFSSTSVSPLKPDQWNA